MAHPAHLAYLFHGTFLWLLQEPCGLGFNPPLSRTGQGHIRDHRGLGLASGVLSEGPALPPGSDLLAPPSCICCIVPLLHLASAVVCLLSPTPTQLAGRFPSLEPLFLS